MTSPAAFPVDVDASGDPLPPVGTHVICRRRSDGRRVTGTVQDNTMGLFLSGTGNGALVLTAKLWDVVAT